MSYAIKVSNLQKIYKLYTSPKDRLKETFSLSNKKLHKDFFALENINFELKKGDTIGVIGKNGSGKSTLLKIIAGILQPTSGNVKMNGKVSALIELGAGFNPEYTGIDNIYFYGTILDFTKDEMDKKLNDIIAFADIGEFLYQPVKTYSSGMKSRLAFSVAIHTEPEILIVDEVLSVGDMFFKQKCINKLRGMLDNGLTLFFVSHSLSEIKSLCSKALFLEKGKQVAFGDSEKVCNVYQNSTTSEQYIATKEQLKNNYNEIMNNISDLSIDIEKSDLKYYKEDINFNKRLTERSGNKKLEIMSFYMYDKNGNQINKFYSYDTVTIRISVKANADIDKGTKFGIVCRNNKGVDVFIINGHEYNLPKLFTGNNHILEINIQLPLVANIYSFTIGLKEQALGNNFYDRCFNAFSFEVKKPLNQSGTGGMIYFYPKKIKFIAEERINE